MKSSTLGKGRQKKKKMRERMRRKTRKKRTQGRGEAAVPGKYFLLINSILPLKDLPTIQAGKIFHIPGQAVAKTPLQPAGRQPLLPQLPRGQPLMDSVGFLREDLPFP